MSLSMENGGGRNSLDWPHVEFNLMITNEGIHGYQQISQF